MKAAYRATCRCARRDSRVVGQSDTVSRSAADSQIRNVNRFQWRSLLTVAISNALSEVVRFAADTAEEWRAVYLRHVNVLLEGPETAIEAVLQRLLPHLREPLVSIQPRVAFSLPDIDIGTLILNDVTRLTMQQQAELLEWLNAASPSPQLISTSRQPVFPRIERGLFAEALYYRLNVIRMPVGSSQFGPPRKSALPKDRINRPLHGCDGHSPLKRTDR